MPMVSRIVSTIIFCLYIYVFIEAVSFGIVYILSGHQGNEHLQHAIDRFHPLFTGRDDAGRLKPPYERDDETNPFRYDPRTGYAHRPNTFYATDLQISPQGFVCGTACEIIEKEKPPDEYRIFILGGSSVAGLGAGGNAKTISSQMAVLADADSTLAAGKTLKIINAGVGGFFSGQELTFLVNTVAQYHPDLVIFLDGYNDYIQWHYINYYPYASRYSPNLDPSRQQYDYMLMEGVQRVRSVGGATLHTLNLAVEQYPVFYYTAVLAKHVRAIGLYTAPEQTGGALHNAAKPSMAPLDDTNKPSVLSYIRNLDLAAGAIRGIRARGLFCLQPTLPLKDTNDQPRKTTLAGREETFVSSSTAIYLTEYYKLAEERINQRQAFNDRSTRFCSLVPLFDKSMDEMYTDEVHYTDTGARALAGALLKEIQSWNEEEAARSK